MILSTLVRAGKREDQIAWMQANMMKRFSWSYQVSNVHIGGILNVHVMFMDVASGDEA